MLGFPPRPDAPLPVNAYDEEWADQYVSRYADRDQPETVAGFLAGLVPPGGAALELCVGAGRLAIPLAGRGLRVTGVDNSAAMLERLRAAPGGGQVEAVLGDCARARLGRRFGLVYIAFNSLFLMPGREQQSAVLATAVRHLAPGGHLVVEAFVSQPVPDGPRVTPSISMVTEDALELLVRHWDTERQVLWIQRAILREGEPVHFRPTRFLYLHPHEIDDAARLAGLELAGSYANWSGDRYAGEGRNRIGVYRLPS